MEQYGEDLPNPSFVEMQMEFIIPPTAALNFASHNMFPNVHQIFRLVCNIPVTSCECERSVSVLRRLKTYLRSNLGQERLSGLALLPEELDALYVLFDALYTKASYKILILCRQSRALLVKDYVIGARKSRHSQSSFVLAKKVNSESACLAEIINFLNMLLYQRYQAATSTLVLTGLLQ